MVGDTPWDVRAASKAHVPTIAVRTGGFGDDELREAGAVALFESVAELVARLDETRAALTADRAGLSRASRAAAIAACPNEMPPSLGGSRLGVSTCRPASLERGRRRLEQQPVLEHAAAEDDRVEPAGRGQVARTRRSVAATSAGVEPGRHRRHGRDPRSRSAAICADGRARIERQPARSLDQLDLVDPAGADARAPRASSSTAAWPS